MTEKQIILTIYVVSLICCWIFNRCMIKQDELDARFSVVFITLFPALNTCWFIFGMIYYFVSIIGMEKIAKIFFLTKDDD